MRSFVVLLFICVKYCNYIICCSCYDNKNNNSQTVNTDISTENDNSQKESINILKEKNNNSKKDNEDIIKNDHINNLKHSNNK